MSKSGRNGTVGPALLAGLALTLAGAGLPSEGEPASDEPIQAPAFDEEGQLLRPSDYREWVYVTSGLGMTYGPSEAAATGEPRFDNVFVTREAYREFLGSGVWPEGTMLMLEVRSAEEHVSINNGGRTQGGLLALEAVVKDGSRFPEGGWAFFSFDGRDGLADASAPLPRSTSCYSCHSKNAAVEQTFVQFYPTLFEAAQRFGTVRPDYDPTHRP